MSKCNHAVVSWQAIFPRISENNDYGRFVVTTVSYLKRTEMVSPEMTHMSVVKIVDLQRHYFLLDFNIPSEISNQGASVKKLKYYGVHNSTAADCRPYNTKKSKAINFGRERRHGEG